jgi:hypothetical protein
MNEWYKLLKNVLLYNSFNFRPTSSKTFVRFSVTAIRIPFRGWSVHRISDPRTILRVDPSGFPASAIWPFRILPTIENLGSTGWIEWRGSTSKTGKNKVSLSFSKNTFSNGILLENYLLKWNVVRKLLVRKKFFSQPTC